MLFLQIDTLHMAQGTERFFNTTPDTVYGLLTGALTIAVVTLFGVYYKKTNEYTGNIMDVAMKCADAMNLIANNLDKLRDASEDDIVLLRQDFERLRSEILGKLDNLAKK